MIDKIEQLVSIYLDKQQTHDNKLSAKEAHKYFSKLLHNNIITYENDGIIIAYVEYWILNYEQLGRVICREPFCAIEEDIRNGDVCLIADLWLEESYRQTSIVKLLKNEVRLKNWHRKYYVGDRIKNNKRCIHIQKIREV